MLMFHHVTLQTALHNFMLLFQLLLLTLHFLFVYVDYLGCEYHFNFPIKINIYTEKNHSMLIFPREAGRETTESRLFLHRAWTVHIIWHQIVYLSLFHLAEDFSPSPACVSLSTEAAFFRPGRPGVIWETRYLGAKQQ